MAVSLVHCIFLNQLLFLYCYTHSYPDNRMLGVWYKDVRVFFVCFNVSDFIFMVGIMCWKNSEEH